MPYWLKGAKAPSKTSSPAGKLASSFSLTPKQTGSGGEGGWVSGSSLASSLSCGCPPHIDRRREGDRRRNWHPLSTGTKGCHSRPLLIYSLDPSLYSSALPFFHPPCLEVFLRHWSHSWGTHPQGVRPRLSPKSLRPYLNLKWPP